MDTADMVHQANQIAQFFSSYSEAEAVAGIEDHLRKFWPPRMRTQLVAHLERGGEGLSALAVSAANRLSA